MFLHANIRLFSPNYLFFLQSQIFLKTFVQIFFRLFLWLFPHFFAINNDFLGQSQTRHFFFNKIIEHCQIHYNNMCWCYTKTHLFFFKCKTLKVKSVYRSRPKFSFIGKINLMQQFLVGLSQMSKTYQNWIFLMCTNQFRFNAYARWLVVWAFTVF